MIIAVFSISRTFNAPRNHVFKAWTEREHLAKWWGPKGFGIEVLKLDLKPGGVFHYAMIPPGGQKMYGKFVFREIVTPERLVYVGSFSDENLGITRHPMCATCPLEMLTTVSFAEDAGKTTVTIVVTPINAPETDIQTFRDIMDSMTKGYGGTMDQLEEHLTNVKKAPMPMKVQPYLYFEGCCEEALNFYRDKIGATGVQLMRYSQSPDPTMSCKGVAPEKVMHGEFRIGETTIMASDGMCSGKPDFKGFALTIIAPSAAEAERIFNALAEGGKIQMPLTKTFFSEKFGMVADRFGVGWMLLVAM